MQESIDKQADKTEEIQSSSIISTISTALANAELPQNICVSLLEGIATNPAIILDLFNILQDDPYLWILVDKEQSLAEDYEPDDLIELQNSFYRVNRAGLLLRKAAAASLEEMAASAANEGLTLTASSAYRSYDYQAEVYERNVREMGQQAADRESARPGHSQHQLGLIVDFGSITDAFAQTAEGRWLATNASRFGWSLSYPDGYEEVTGYRWESWHYRYVGRELAEFIDNYFEGIQQYALKFIYEYKKISN
ncbi:MAG: M15 family metallopeptidase [Treponema sp.]|nr:M15 family metallopeptidase [Treponema sp.]